VGIINTAPEPAPVAESAPPANPYEHPAVLARSVALLGGEPLAAVFRTSGRTDWTARRSVESSDASAALLLVVLRPAWAETSPFCQEALGDFLAPVVEWTAGRTTAELSAAWGVGTLLPLTRLLDGLRERPGLEGVPRSNAWAPTNAQAALALRLLAANPRIPYAGIIDCLGKIGQAPTRTAFSTWASEVTAPKKPGRPKAPNPAFLRALAFRNGQTLGALAKEVGCTAANLSYYLRAYPNEIAAAAQEAGPPPENIAKTAPGGPS